MQESACVLAWWPSPCPTITICRWVPERCRLGTGRQGDVVVQWGGHSLQNKGSAQQKRVFCALTRQLSLLLPDIQEMLLQSPAGAHPAFPAAWQRAGERHLLVHPCQQSIWEWWKCFQLQRDKSFDPTPVRLFSLGQCSPLGGWRGGGLALGRTRGAQLCLWGWTLDLAAWGPERALILLCGLWGGAAATQGFLGWVKKKHNCRYLLSPPLKSDFHLLSSPKTSQPLANGKG